ncbi:MAG: DEAD/DEAH box helicase family protein [Anaerobacillus sp.]|uniref:DEAD/DEAH box helicase family protein n=1 Tax=Anaerobacillus sp. TaxID=1872506 RepID=UPI00391C28B0
MKPEIGNYFQELHEQITDRSKWDEERFMVFGHEAGSGKSQMTFKFIGEMTKTKTYRVLFVQKFSRDDELINTVSKINEHAGNIVAMKFSKEDTGNKKRKQQAEEAQVLCITHQMYQLICKGEHAELIKDRQILIIDEYPHIIETIHLCSEDIGKLWINNYKYGLDLSLDAIVNFLRNLLHQKKANKNFNKMLLIEFNIEEQRRYKKVVNQLLSRVSDDGDKKILSKINYLLSYGGYMYENAFYTYREDIDYKMFQNNIILDANASFDTKYSLSKKFHRISQPKIFNYSNTIIHHSVIKTGKCNLKKYINFNEKVLSKVSPERKNKILFITDKEREQGLSISISDYFLSLGYSKKEAEMIIEERIKVDHFGNLIGVNTYRDFDTVVITKTPNYDYISYAMTFYHLTQNKKEDQLQLFKHEEIESLRESTVAGEIYQAIKRINRDNSKNCEIFLFMDNEKVESIIRSQFPQIHYHKDQFEVDSKKVNKPKKEKKSDIRIGMAKKYLLEYKEKGAPFIRKIELRNFLGINDGGNLRNEVLLNLMDFFKEERIFEDGQKIFLNNPEGNQIS